MLFLLYLCFKCHVVNKRIPNCLSLDEVVILKSHKLLSRYFQREQENDCNSGKEFFSESFLRASFAAEVFIQPFKN